MLEEYNVKNHKLQLVIIAVISMLYISELKSNQMSW